MHTVCDTQVLCVCNTQIQLVTLVQYIVCCPCNTATLLNIVLLTFLYMYTAAKSVDMEVDINMEAQRVFVTTTLSSDEVFATIKKTGREAEYISSK